MDERSLPLEGRCNHKREDGTYCHGHRVRGGLRCARHGNATIRAVRRKRLEAAAEAEVQAALTDPRTMDVREPIALSRVILEHTPLEASDDEAIARARNLKMRAIGPELVTLWKQQIRRSHSGGDDIDTMLDALDVILEPEAGDIERAIRDIHKESLELVSRHSQRQVDASKAMQWTDTIREVVHPFLMELGLQLSAVIREFVPAERQRSALEAVARVTQRTLGLVSQSSQKASPVPGSNR